MSHTLIVVKREQFCFLGNPDQTETNTATSEATAVTWLDKRNFRCLLFTYRSKSLLLFFHTKWLGVEKGQKNILFLDFCGLWGSGLSWFCWTQNKKKNNETCSSNHALTGHATSPCALQSTASSNLKGSPPNIATRIIRAALWSAPPPPPPRGMFCFLPLERGSYDLPPFDRQENWAENSVLLPLFPQIPWGSGSSFECQKYPKTSPNSMIVELLLFFWEKENVMTNRDWIQWGF